MGKYEPLRNFCANQRADRDCHDVRRNRAVIGFKLPRSASEHRAWWSNNPSNSVMTKAWLEAGYQSEQVDMENRKLVFSRTADAGPTMRRIRARCCRVCRTSVRSMAGLKGPCARRPASI